jgi:hypothetical protein
LSSAAAGTRINFELFEAPWHDDVRWPRVMLTTWGYQQTKKKDQYISRTVGAGLGSKASSLTNRRILFCTFSSSFYFDLRGLQTVLFLLHTHLLRGLPKSVKTGLFWKLVTIRSLTTLSTVALFPLVVSPI